MFFFGCDADDTMQYVVFLNPFDVSGLYLEILFLVTRVFTGSRNLIFNSTRCLQIHYDRLGKDGLFSHKEVTVLFVPDFSECLPSLDAWRDQWAMACSQEGCCREGAPTFFEK